MAHLSTICCFARAEVRTDLKIAVVAPLVTPLTPVPTGGSQAFVVDLARGLASRGHEVALYCAAPSDVPGVATVQIPVEPGLERALVAMTGRTRTVPGMGRAYSACYSELRSHGADAVSQHGFDAEAIELADRLPDPLPILHTL